MHTVGYICTGLYLATCIVIINIPLKKIDKRNENDVVNKTKGLFKAFSISIFGALINLMLILYLSTYEYTNYLCALSVIIFLFGSWLKVFTKRKNLSVQTIFFALMFFFTTVIALFLKSVSQSGGIL